MNDSITPETDVNTLPDSGTGELRVRADQGRTVSLVTAVWTVRVSVTLIAGLDTVEQTGALELSGGAGEGGTLCLISPVFTVRHSVTLPGLGQTQARHWTLVLRWTAGNLNILLVRIVSTVVISIISVTSIYTLSIIALELILLAEFDGW